MPLTRVSRHVMTFKLRCRYALEIANDEINHVADLRALLGSAALPCPALDIGPAFAAAVVAALGTQKSKDIPFSPYENDLFFLHGARYSSTCCSLLSWLAIIRCGQVWWGQYPAYF